MGFWPHFVGVFPHWLASRSMLVVSTWARLFAYHNGPIKASISDYFVGSFHQY